MQVVANVFRWPKLQSMVEHSYLVQEFLDPRASPTNAEASSAAVQQLHQRGQLRKLTAFARGHSLNKAAAEAAAVTGAARQPPRTAAAIVQQVRLAAEMALGDNLTANQPLMDAGMDSLGELPPPACLSRS